ncbi:transcription termination factor 2 [Elysia marginata]|uniref:Transcription termination factor 2 n=1 Tax=Elysia marginata TaxID=1093978 RepID=A0AAV4JG12_9GAST|nr:transcription termination factor 2 [Elysia marginata]
MSVVEWAKQTLTHYSRSLVGLSDRTASAAPPLISTMKVLLQTNRNFKKICDLKILNYGPMCLKRVRFLCKDTIEEKILGLQTSKLSLAKAVLTGSQTTSKKLTLNDLRLIFGV